MTESPVEQVRGGVDIVDLISQYVTLKRAGRTFKALCPFHAEKTPSFVVFPDTGRWHCFGCGEGGDVFTFLMKHENLTFPEALRRLADRIGVVITQVRESPEKKEANARLYAANEAAAVYYNSVLLNSQPARRYVAGRGVTDDTIREFLLGLAPDSFEALQRHLHAQGFTNDELLSAGLLYEPENGPLRDRYRGRWMFPIRDADGRIVSFGARGMTPDAQPKYLNGPQTNIFDKGNTLFGLHDGVTAIKQERRAVVVEGYVDVVITHQAGFKNVVATLGTAISERQLRTLARLASEICFALDPDAAGQAAALRGAETAQTALADTAVLVPTYRGLIRYEAGSRATLTVATLPDGKDPDEIVLADPARWSEAIGSARPVVDHALDWVASRHDLSTASGKAEAMDALVPLLQAVADPIRRAHYVELTAQRLKMIDARALVERLRQLGSSRPGATARRLSPTTTLSRRPREQSSALVGGGGRPPRGIEQHYAIALLVEAAQRGLPYIAPDASDFSDPEARALLLRLVELIQTDARAEWRPDLLELAREQWLERPEAAVRQYLADVQRLADVQITASLHSIGRQLHDGRLALELPELVALANEADSEVQAQIRARIGEIARERVISERMDAGQHGPAGVGQRVATIPSRFRT
ncbi:MAG: primase [Chloroflexi bacterium]|nr:primase [Chloroflexota bacterium]